MGIVTYSADRENEVSKIFVPRLQLLICYISSACLMGSGTIFIPAERLQFSDLPRKQNESI